MMQQITNIVEEYYKLLAWMPSFLQDFLKFTFMFFCAAALITITSKFIRFVRG